MSGNQAKANALLSELLQNWYVPTFLHKLASDYKIEISTSEEAQNLLKLAAAISAAEAVETVTKSAQPTPVGEFIKAATNEVYENAHALKKEAQADAVKRVAAYQVAQANQTLRDAALLYGYLTNGGKVA